MSERAEHAPDAGVELVMFHSRVADVPGQVTDVAWCVRALCKQLRGSRLCKGFLNSAGCSSSYAAAVLNVTQSRMVGVTSRGAVLGPLLGFGNPC